MSNKQEHIAVTIRVGENYFAELDQRLTQYGITRSELADAAGWDKSHVSRLFNTQPDVLLSTIARIETAVAKLRAEKRLKKV